jgi:hypothetical protein
VAELTDQLDARHAIYLGVADDEIAPAQGIYQLNGGLAVVGMEDSMPLVPKGADHELDDGGVLVSDEDIPAGEPGRGGTAHYRP